MIQLKNLPDRDLDAWLAEHVMGWKWYRIGLSRIIRAPDSWIARNGSRQLADGTEPIADPDVFPMGEFSTDPAASKVLRDRMRELGWLFFLCSNLKSEPSKYTYECEVWKPDFDTFKGYSDTEERAVAEAAAAALGYGKENERG